MLKFLPEVLYAKSSVQSYQSLSLKWAGSGYKSALELNRCWSGKWASQQSILTTALSRLWCWNQLIF